MSPKARPGRSRSASIPTRPPRNPVPAPVVTEGWYSLMEATSMLVLGHPGPGIGVQVPEGASEIGILVQCSGDRIALYIDPGMDAATVDCSDPAAQQRVTFPAEGLGIGVYAGSDGIDWVRMTPEADGKSDRAPVGAAAPTGTCRGRLRRGRRAVRSVRQPGNRCPTVAPVSGAPLALAGGEMVGVAVPADDGTGMGWKPGPSRTGHPSVCWPRRMGASTKPGSTRRISRCSTA